MTTLKVAGLDKPIALESVVWIKGDGNYARIHFDHGQLYLATQTLRWFESQIPVYIRIHKSILINPVHVVRFDQSKAKEAQVLMSTGHFLGISRRRIDLVRAMLGMAPFDASSFQTPIVKERND